MANLVLALASSNKSTKLLPYYFSKKELVFKSRNKKGIISWFLKIFFNPKEITGSSPTIQIYHKNTLFQGILRNRKCLLFLKLPHGYGKGYLCLNWIVAYLYIENIVGLIFTWQVL